MSKKTKLLFRGLVAIAVIGMGSIAMVGVKAADPPVAADRGGVQLAEPMVPLSRAVVEGLADEDASNVALVDHEGEIQQVLALSSDGPSKVNMNPPESSQIGGQGESQAPEQSCLRNRSQTIVFGSLVVPVPAASVPLTDRGIGFDRDIPLHARMERDPWKGV